MTRLERSRKGKTTIDVTVTKQDGLGRVRLSMGEQGSYNHRNSDLDAREVRDLITLLEWHLAKVTGAIPWDNDDN